MLHRKERDIPSSDPPLKIRVSYFPGVRLVPRVFLNAELAQAYHVARIPNMNPLTFRQTPQAVQFRESKALRHAYKTIPYRFRFLRMAFVIR